MPYKNPQDTRDWQKHQRKYGGGKVQARQLRYRRGLRFRALNALGGKCKKCRFADPRALQIDHINGKGGPEVKRIGQAKLHWKILRGEIAEYQLLCANCNWIKKYERNEVHYNFAAG